MGFDLFYGGVEEIGKNAAKKKAAHAEPRQKQAWTGVCDYLGRNFDDVAEFFVMCAPAKWLVSYYIYILGKPFIYYILGKPRVNCWALGRIADKPLGFYVIFRLLSTFPGVGLEYCTPLPRLSRIETLRQRTSSASRSTAVFQAERPVNQRPVHSF